MLSCKDRRPRAALAALLLVSLSGCGGDPDYLRLEGATMGTYYRVTCRCPDAPAAGLAARVEGILAEVNGQMSTYDPDSELSRFNGSEAGSVLPVSAPLLTVIDAAAAITALSGGAFDVTVGPLINLWGFGPAGTIGRAPEPAAIAEALDRVGMQHLVLDTRNGTLEKRAPLYVDLSAIAKGHGVDRVASGLVAAGCTDLLVDIGGEVKGLGRNPAGQPWRVGIEVPDPETFGAVQKILPLADRAVATSGDYRNFLDLEDGQQVSHTIDPRNGRPVTHRLASVSVVHDSAMWADGLATALNVLGPDEGWALAEREGLAAVFLVRRASGFEERYTSALQKYLDSQP